MTGVRRENHWNSTGHALHRNQIRSTFGSIWKEPDIHLSQNSRHLGIGDKPQVQYLLFRNAVGARPSVQIDLSVRSEGNRLHTRIHIQ